MIIIRKEVTAPSSLFRGREGSCSILGRDLTLHCSFVTHPGRVWEAQLHSCYQRSC